MKVLILILSAWVLMGSSCSVKEELKGLQTLRAECENLQLELDSLGAKKWTKTIDTKVKECKDHGFWAKAKRKKIDIYMDGL